MNYVEAKKMVDLFEKIGKSAEYDHYGFWGSDHAAEGLDEDGLWYVVLRFTNRKTGNYHRHEQRVFNADVSAIISAAEKEWKKADGKTRKLKKASRELENN